jgi:choline monooxygenase
LTKTLVEILGADALEAMMRPTADAVGMPSTAYTSEAFFELENASLWRRTWVCAGFAHDVPNAGDAMPIELAAVPLMLVRDRDGAINVFFNACRHRSMKVLPEARKACVRLTCPYHGWSYDLDGSLKATPRFGGPGSDTVEHHDRSKLGLIPVRAEQWHDWIFVNIDGTAAPFADYAKPMIDRLAPYDLSALRHTVTIDFEIKANWKLIQENFVECYHNHFVHPTIDRVVPATDHYMFMDGQVVGLGNRSPFDDDPEICLPRFPELPDELLEDGHYYHLFPSLDINVWRDQVTTMQVLPAGPDRTLERYDIYLIGNAATDAKFETRRREAIDAWKMVNDEDVEVVERLQEGHRANISKGGIYSPYWETTVHHFHRLMLDALR